jgi:hypothetical protein
MSIESFIDWNLKVFGWNLGPVAGPVFILYLLLLILQFLDSLEKFSEVLKNLKMSNLQQSSSHGLPRPRKKNGRNSYK